MVVCKCGKRLFAGLTLAEEEHGSFGTGPPQRDSAELFAGRAESFARGFLGALYQPTRGPKILDAREAPNVLPLLSEDQRQNLPTPGNRL